MHEIITLQFGQRSNYLCTHFWNAQESYFTYSSQESPVVNHDVLFRAGLGEGRIDTFTPRTLIYDLKGGFGSLRKINALYDAQDDPSVARLWDGTTSTQSQPAIEPSSYQTLLDSGLPTSQVQSQDVRYWSDFNRIFYHPRSAVQLNQYELNSELMPFENWATGEELFRDLDKDVDLLDRDVRPFAEECDQMQGMQLVTGTDDAWGGFAARYLDALRDEYGKTSLWVWGIENTARTARRTHLVRQSNDARSVAAYGQQASMFIPMATLPKLPSYVHLQDNDWTTSALHCAAFESAILPTRLVSTSTGSTSLAHLENALNTNGSQNILDLQLSHLDDGSTSSTSATNGEVHGEHNGVDRYGEAHRTASIDRFDIDFLPVQEQERDREHVFARAEVYRSHRDDTAVTAMPANDERVRRGTEEQTIIERFSTRLAFPRLDSYPETLFRTGHSDPHFLELKTALSSSSTVRKHVLQLRSAAQLGISRDERESIYNDLSAISNNYTHGWDSGSDSGEDD